jgi:hypothetical protein
MSQSCPHGNPRITVQGSRGQAGPPESSHIPATWTGSSSGDSVPKSGELGAMAFQKVHKPLY